MGTCSCRRHTGNPGGEDLGLRVLDRYCVISHNAHLKQVGVNSHSCSCNSVSEGPEGFHPAQLSHLTTMALFLETESCLVAQVGLKLTILLFLHSRRWDRRYGPLCLSVWLDLLFSDDFLV